MSGANRVLPVADNRTDHDTGQNRVTNMVVATTDMHVVTGVKVIRVIKMAVPVRRQIVITMMPMPTLHHDYRPLIAIMSPVRVAVARVIVIMTMTVMMTTIAITVVVAFMAA